MKVLQFCNSTIPAMVKIYYLTKRAGDAILKPVIELDDQKCLGLLVGLSFQAVLRNWMKFLVVKVNVWFMKGMFVVLFQIYFISY